jgi:hypothetical protein
VRDDGAGRTTAQQQAVHAYLEAGWDFVDGMQNGTEDIWWIDEGQDCPRLWQELLEDVTKESDLRTY